MTTRPRMTGRAPLSPLRTRVHQILTYSPRVFAMTSGAAMAAASSASDGCSTSVLTGAPCWLLGRRFGPGGGATPGGARGHQLDDRLGVVLGQRPDRDELAQAQHRHPVGHGHHVVQVVRDDDDRDVLALQPADEVEYDAGLGDAQGG